MVLSGNTHAESRPRTVLWAVPVPEIGGVARHVLDAAKEGLPGWRLVVLCPEGALAQRLRDSGAAVVTGAFGPDVGFWQSTGTLRKHLRHLRPEIVHSHLAFADVVAAAAVLGTPVRLVTTEHGIAGDDAVYHGAVWKSRTKATMHRIRLLRANAVIAVSEATKSAILSKWKPRQTITVIPNGVNGPEVRRRLEEFRHTPIAPEGPRVLSLSRLAPEKGLDRLLRAFALVLEQNSEASLTVAGEGPDRAALEGLATELGIGRAVDFPGFVEPLAAMAKADVLVQLSVWENCSYTLLDAVCAGIGVVATDVGGNSEIVPPEALVGERTDHAVAQKILAQARRQPLPSDGQVCVSVAEMAARISAAYAVCSN